MFESGSSTEEKSLWKIDGLDLLFGWFQIKSHLPLQGDGDTDSSVTAAVICLISRNYTNSCNNIKPMETWVGSAGRLTFYVRNDGMSLTRGGSFLHLSAEGRQFSTFIMRAKR